MALRDNLWMNAADHWYSYRVFKGKAFHFKNFICSSENWSISAFQRILSFQQKLPDLVNGYRQVTIGLAWLFRSKLACLTCKSCHTLIRLAFSANFEIPSSSARWQTILKFNDNWCGSIWTHARFDLGGLLWDHCCLLQRH